MSGYAEFFQIAQSTAITSPVSGISSAKRDVGGAFYVPLNLFYRHRL